MYVRMCHFGIAIYNNLPDVCVCARTCVHAIQLHDSSCVCILICSSMGDMVTITTISPLDYENRTQYDLTIFVTDGENCSSSPDMGYFSDEINVHVTVLDVNDRPPVFSSDNYTFVIDETQVVGYTVGNVSASDLDSGAILTYSINSDL